MNKTVPLAPFLTRIQGPIFKRNTGRHRAAHKTRGLPFTPITDEQYLDIVRAGFRVTSPSRRSWVRS